jgi:DNA-binding GntR family transcriptional regulator
MVARLPSAPTRKERPSLSDEAASYVRALVMSGALLPGDFVRIEMVAEALGISATPAREALQALRVEGFLHLEPRRGFVVAELQGQDIRDLFTAQALIAGELASRAAVRASDQDLRELDVAHRAVTDAARSGDTEALETHNDTFHRVLNRAAGTRKLAWVLGLLVRYVPRQFYGSIDGWPSATVDDHSEILESIHRHDGEAARRAMVEHINHAGELLARHFDERMAATRPQPGGVPGEVAG